MLEFFSNPGVIFWCCGIVIAIGGSLLMRAAHADNVRREQEDAKSKRVCPSCGRPLDETSQRLKTIATLMTETQWLTAAEIETASKHHAQPLEDFKRRGLIYGITGSEGKDLFPSYQFDSAMRPLPVIQDVLRAFGPVADPWALVAWFHFPNGWLVRPDDPQRRPWAPKDFLDNEAAVVRAAGRPGLTFVS